MFLFWVFLQESVKMQDLKPFNATLLIFSTAFSISVLERVKLLMNAPKRQLGNINETDKGIDDVNRRLLDLQVRLVWNVGFMQLGVMQY